MMICATCGLTREGGPRLPKGWKRHKEVVHCKDCWQKAYVLRAAIIPVAEPLSGSWEDFRAADHPHTRGENVRRVHHHNIEGGPSPHAWGKRHYRRYCRQRCRTIPTRVGKTETVEAADNDDADHPHTRGENAAMWNVVAVMGGPSPHAWGKRR